MQNLEGALWVLPSLSDIPLAWGRAMGHPQVFRVSVMQGP